MAEDPLDFPQLSDALNANGRLHSDLLFRLAIVERYKANLARMQARRIRELFERKLVPLWLERSIHLPEVPGQALVPQNSARLRSLYRRLNEEIETVITALAGETREDLVQFARAEAAAVARSFARAVPSEIGVEIGSASNTLLRKAVTSRPFQGKFLREHYRELSASAKSATRAAIQTGITDGEDIATIARRLRGIVGEPLSPSVKKLTVVRAQGIARTAVSHVTNAARLETHQANSDLIRAERFTATLDTSTTVTCFSLDGNEHPIGSGPYPPVHFNCRSVRIPMLVSWRELGFGFDDLTPQTRASMDGQVAEIEAEVWFKQQNKARQVAVLGEKRWALWKANDELPFKKLLGPGLEPLSFAELEAKYASSL